MKLKAEQLIQMILHGPNSLKETAKQVQELLDTQQYWLVTAKRGLKKFKIVVMAKDSAEAKKKASLGDKVGVRLLGEVEDL